MSPASPVGDFTFVWEDEARTIFTPTLEYHLENVPSGEYVVTVTHVASECVSEATLFVENMSENPLVSVSEVQADQSCDPLLSNGVIMSSVDGGIDHTDPRYEFSWFEDVGGEADPAGVILTTTATLSMENAGRYWVSVRNVDSNCETSMPGNITADPLAPRVGTDDIEYGASTVCQVNPFRPADGTARLRGVTPGDLADYNISFYDENPQNNPSALPLTTITNGNAFFSELVHTTPYFVQLQHAGLGCLSEIYQLQVPDEAEAPIVAIDRVLPVTHCNPENPNGEIEAQVRQNATSPFMQNTRDYTWIWERLMPDPSTGIIEGNETSASNLRAGVYRIIAESNATGCADTLDYSLQDVSQTPDVKVEVRGNSLCAAPYDGLAVASVINPLPDRNYNFIWLVNDGGPIPSRSESDVIVASVDTLRDNLEYRVIAYDQDDDFCRTNTPLVFSVPSLRRDPVVNVQVTQLLTYCPLYTDNPLHFPNGVLRAVVPDDEDYEQSHDFAWSASGTPDEVISEGVFLEQIAEGDYFVVVTEKRTQCDARASHYLNSNFQLPVAPDVVIQSQNTGCILPNGRVTASVGGDEAPYFFEWFSLDTDNGGIILDEEGEPVDTPEVTGLSAGMYEVFAIEKESRCRSSAATVFSVVDNLREKLFSVRANPSLCSEPTGSAVIDFEDNFNISRIDWLSIADSRVIETEDLINVSPGDYEVTITEVSGCEHSLSLTVPNTIKVYNGISPNGDNMNDYFYIDCIDRFTSNVVRIYDRSGNLVYEQAGYNNTDRIFRGESNAGGVFLGKQLPSGTYFYAIELGDGQEALTGFVEVLR